MDGGLRLTDILRRRAILYRRLAVFAGLAGLAGLALAVAFWMPWWGSAPAFRDIAIDWHIETWWDAYVSRAHHADEAGGGVWPKVAWTMASLGLGVAGLVLWVRRRPGLGRALIGLAVLLGVAVPQGLGRRGVPEIYAEARDVTPAVAATLAAAVQTTQGQAMVYHQILYPAGSKPGDGPIGWGSLDTFGAASIAPEIHYILAQRAYLAGQAADTQAQLDAIDRGHVPVTYTSAYRLNVMRDWVAARGYRARGADFATPFPAIPAAWHRALSWGGGGLMVVACLLALACLVLSAVVRRRAGRIDTYAAQLALRTREGLQGGVA